MTTNPSHLLIARNSRGHNNPSASLSSPTETHAAAAGIFRSSGSPPWLLEEVQTDDLVSELDIDSDDEAIEIDETFTKNSKFPGTVKIVVESTTFWAHKEVLYFASPFFEAALSGNWAETGRPLSVSSMMTISKPPSIPGDKNVHGLATGMTFAPMDPDVDPEELEVLADLSSTKSSAPSTVVDESEENLAGPSGSDPNSKARTITLAKLQGGIGDPRPEGSSGHGKSKSLPGREHFSPRKRTVSHASIQRRPKTGPDAVIVLKEERASAFHDFLKFVYPHLECTITWNNAEGLMNIAHKLSVPSLQEKCLTFLLLHAAGNPIKALRIAEMFEEEDLYRESSRYFLDNSGGWPEHELSTLSPATLLKLEKRRNWFLERVLKLGLTPVAKEYQCCATCPDPSSCARMLEERWRQAYHAVFRIGPPQPSMVFRYLRMLEGISPPLALLHSNCQATAKAFIATLFDRMFSLGVRGSGTEIVPVGGRVGAATVMATTAGPKRQFLYCTLKSDPTPRVRGIPAREPL